MIFIQHLYCSTHELFVDCINTFYSRKHWKVEPQEFHKRAITDTDSVRQLTANKEINIFVQNDDSARPCRLGAGYRLLPTSIRLIFLALHHPAPYQ